MKRALLCLVLMATACPRAAGDDPVEAYQSLVRNAQRGEVKAGYAALSTQTRHLLDNQSKALSAASDGGVKDDPAGLFFAQLQRPAAIIEISVTERDAGTALLKVSGATGASVVRMLKEDGAWKLDLTDTLK
jgi:hypothetical protein